MPGKGTAWMPTVVCDDTLCRSTRMKYPTGLRMWFLFVASVPRFNSSQPDDRIAIPPAYHSLYVYYICLIHPPIHMAPKDDWKRQVICWYIVNHCSQARMFCPFDDTLFTFKSSYYIIRQGVSTSFLNCTSHEIIYAIVALFVAGYHCSWVKKDSSQICFQLFLLSFFIRTLRTHTTYIHVYFKLWRKWRRKYGME